MARQVQPTIAGWDQSKLAKFVAQAIFNTPANLPPSLTNAELEATDLLTISGDLALSDQAVATLKTYLGLP